MRIVKEESEFGINIALEEGEKYLSIAYRGNLDLYWSIKNKNKKSNHDFLTKGDYDYFIITKENYAIYNLFEQLFFDIENMNIYDEEDIPFGIETEEEIQQYLIKKEKDKEELRERCILYDSSYYNELFNANNKTITWYSDETSYKVANILKIIKEENIFKVEFYTQPHIDGYSRDFYSLGYIPIRISNSGSSYDPFNIVFMRMYNKMKEVDDVNDIGHQIHIEEYLYNKEQVKKLEK